MKTALANCQTGGLDWLQYITQSYSANREDIFCSGRRNRAKGKSFVRMEENAFLA